MEHAEYTHGPARTIDDNMDALADAAYAAQNVFLDFTELDFEEANG